MATATMIYTYRSDENKLYIHYPHITVSVPVEEGCDGKYVVFEDDYDMNEFMGYLEDHDLDTSELNPCAFGDFEIRALPLKELL